MTDEWLKVIKSKNLFKIHSLMKNFDVEVFFCRYTKLARWHFSWQIIKPKQTSTSWEHWYEFCKHNTWHQEVDGNHILDKFYRACKYSRHVLKKCCRKFFEREILLLLIEYYCDLDVWRPCGHWRLQWFVFSPVDMDTPCFLPRSMS